MHCLLLILFFPILSTCHYLFNLFKKYIIYRLQISCWGNFLTVAEREKKTFRSQLMEMELDEVQYLLALRQLYGLLQNIGNGLQDKSSENVGLLFLWLSMSWGLDGSANHTNACRFLSESEDPVPSTQENFFSKRIQKKRKFLMKIWMATDPSCRTSKAFFSDLLVLFCHLILGDGLGYCRN